MARIVICKECGKEKPYYAKGLCKACYDRRWRKANPECGRRYRKTHREERVAYSRQWHAANPDYGRRHHCEHREEINARHRLHYWEHLEQERARGREYSREHRRERLEYSRRWEQDNPDKMREKARRRRARKRNATIGPVDEAAIYERDKVCIYCGAAEDLTLDHLAPLARGGPHRQDNLAVACRSCNSSKGTKTYDEFMEVM